MVQFPHILATAFSFYFSGLHCLAFLVGLPQLLKENHGSFLRDDVSSFNIHLENCLVRFSVLVGALKGTVAL